MTSSMILGITLTLLSQVQGYAIGTNSAQRTRATDSRETENSLKSTWSRTARASGGMGSHIIDLLWTSVGLDRRSLANGEGLNRESSLHSLRGAGGTHAQGQTQSNAQAQAQAQTQAQSYSRAQSVKVSASLVKLAPLLLALGSSRTRPVTRGGVQLLLHTPDVAQELIRVQDVASGARKNILDDGNDLDLRNGLLSEGGLQSNLVLLNDLNGVPGSDEDTTLLNSLGPSSVEDVYENGFADDLLDDYLDDYLDNELDEGFLDYDDDFIDLDDLIGDVNFGSKEEGNVFLDMGTRGQGVDLGNVLTQVSPGTGGLDLPSLDLDLGSLGLDLGAGGTDLGTLGLNLGVGGTELGSLGSLGLDLGGGIADLGSLGLDLGGGSIDLGGTDVGSLDVSGVIGGGVDLGKGSSDLDGGDLDQGINLDATTLLQLIGAGSSAPVQQTSTVFETSRPASKTLSTSSILKLLAGGGAPSTTSLILQSSLPSLFKTFDLQPTDLGVGTSFGGGSKGSTRISNAVAQTSPSVSTSFLKLLGLGRIPSSTRVDLKGILTSLGLRGSTISTSPSTSIVRIVKRILSGQASPADVRSILKILTVLRRSSRTRSSSQGGVSSQVTSAQTSTSQATSGRTASGQTSSTNTRISLRSFLQQPKILSAILRQIRVLQAGTSGIRGTSGTSTRITGASTSGNIRTTSTGTTSTGGIGTTTGRTGITAGGTGTTTGRVGTATRRMGTTTGIAGTTGRSGSIRLSLSSLKTLLNRIKGAQALGASQTTLGTGIDASLGIPAGGQVSTSSQAQTTGGASSSKGTLPTQTVTPKSSGASKSDDEDANTRDELIRQLSALGVSIPSLRLSTAGSAAGLYLSGNGLDSIGINALGNSFDNRLSGLNGVANGISSIDNGLYGLLSGITSVTNDASKTYPVGSISGKSGIITGAASGTISGTTSRSATDSSRGVIKLSTLLRKLVGTAPSQTTGSSSTASTSTRVKLSDMAAVLRKLGLRGTSTGSSNFKSGASTSLSGTSAGNLGVSLKRIGGRAVLRFRPPGLRSSVSVPLSFRTSTLASNLPTVSSPAVSRDIGSQTFSSASTGLRGIVGFRPSSSSTATKALLKVIASSVRNREGLGIVGIRRETSVDADDRITPSKLVSTLPSTTVSSATTVGRVTGSGIATGSLGTLATSTATSSPDSGQTSPGSGAFKSGREGNPITKIVLKELTPSSSAMSRFGSTPGSQVSSSDRTTEPPIPYSEPTQSEAQMQVTPRTSGVAIGSQRSSSSQGLEKATVTAANLRMGSPGAGSSFGSSAMLPINTLGIPTEISHSIGGSSFSAHPVITGSDDVSRKTLRGSTNGFGTGQAASGMEGLFEFLNVVADRVGGGGGGGGGGGQASTLSSFGGHGVQERFGLGEFFAGGSMENESVDDDDDDDDDYDNEKDD